MKRSGIPSDWKRVLSDELQPTLKNIELFLRQESAAGKAIFPEAKNIFRALTVTPLDQVKAVILGQDPYHGEQQAHGLSFSVPSGLKIPPSLRNIYKELKTDLGTANRTDGDLTGWAEQGVLLLNAVLTVESGAAGSHAGKGWETVTDALIKAVSDNRDGVVFILWGNYALKKRSLIDESKHCVISSPHPSPLSASRGFFGSRPFSAANRYLKTTGQQTIQW